MDNQFNVDEYTLEIISKLNDDDVKKLENPWWILIADGSSGYSVEGFNHELKWSVDLNQVEIQLSL